METDENETPTSMDQAPLDLSIKNCILSDAPVPLQIPPHPQISITDEQGEVTSMSWNAYAHLSGKNGGAYYHRVGLENLQNNLIGVVGGSVVGGGGKLAKSSSGSIEVQLSSNCSQLTAGQIYALIKESIGDTKGLSYHENDANDASALFLGRPDEDIHIAVEVSPAAGPQGLKGLKIRRISGDYVRYDRICNELIACINI